MNISTFPFRKSPVSPPLYSLPATEYGSCSSLDSTDSFKYFTPNTDQDELTRTQKTVKEKLGGWLHDFLAQPNPDLVAQKYKGQRGYPAENRAVCPFMPKALARNGVHIAVVSSLNPTPEKIEERVMRLKKDYKEKFLPEDSTSLDAKYITAILAFPRARETDLDQVAKRVKPSFVKEGLMVGSLGPENQTRSRYNSNFFTSQAEEKIIAARVMVPEDLPFLDNPKDPPELRIGYLEDYQKRFPNKNTQDVQERLESIERERFSASMIGGYPQA